MIRHVLLSAGITVVTATGALASSWVVPVTMVWTDRTICSAQAIATATNVNEGDEFTRNDAKARADADSRCKVANNIFRNVTDSLNKNFSDNMSDNLSENLNRSLHHNMNRNIHDAWNRGSMVGL